MKLKWNASVQYQFSCSVYSCVLISDALCRWFILTPGTWWNYQKHPPCLVQQLVQTAHWPCSSTPHPSVYRGTLGVTGESHLYVCEWHSGAVVSALVSQQEGPGFKLLWLTEAFLSRVRIGTPCADVRFFWVIHFPPSVKKHADDWLL